MNEKNKATLGAGSPVMNETVESSEAIFKPLPDFDSEMERVSYPLTQRVKVKLKKPHTHAGIGYGEAAVAAGVEIEITESQAKVLKGQGVI
jgi:hypothetical protein